MTNRLAETSPVAHARVAGLLALITLVSGSFSGFVHSRLVVSGDAATTASSRLIGFQVGLLSQNSGRVADDRMFWLVDSLYSAFSSPDLWSAGLLTFRGSYCGTVMDVVAFD
jgi:hypothetical protein